MPDWRYRRLLRQAWHPSDEELLLVVESEADARAVRRVDDHLAGCWACRGRRAEIERSIGAYMAWHRDPAREVVPEDDGQAARRFAAALARASASEAAGDGHRVGHVARRLAAVFPRRGVWHVVRAAVAVLALVVIARLWMAPSTVSARELLARVDRAEQQQLEAVQRPVVYQRLHVTRTPAVDRETAAEQIDSATWELWAERSGGRTATRVAERLAVVAGVATAPGGRTGEPATSRGGTGASSSPPAVLAALRRVLRENGMDPALPLSPAAFAAWRGAVGAVADEVREVTLPDGTSALALVSSARSTVGIGRIARTEVIVRTRDWHPIGQVLTVIGAAGRQQYTVTELEYRVLPLAAVDAALFRAVPDVTIEPAPSARPSESAAAAPTRSANPIEEALRAHEVNHVSGRCLQDRDGVAPDAPFDGTAMPDMWAVRRLAEWALTIDRDALDRDARARLARLVRDHLAGARRHIAAASRSGSPGDAASGDADEPWTTRAMKAFAAVEYASRPDAADDAAARAQAALAALDDAMRRFAGERGADPPAADTRPSDARPD